MAFVSDRNWRRPTLSILKWLGIVVGSTLVLLIVLAVIMELGDWRNPASSLVSAISGRKITITGPLKIHALSFTPTATAKDIEISNPQWADQPIMGKVDEVQVAVRLLPLFSGDVILPKIAVDNPDLALLRTEDGRTNWNFAKQDDAQSARDRGAPTKLPVIRDLQIQNGKIHFEDRKKNLNFVGTINSSNRTDASNRGHFALEGQGQYARAPFQLLVSGNSLLNVEPDKPYDFQFKVQAENSVIAAKGVVDHPFDFGSLQADLSIQGQDLATLYDITGLALPNTPPYKVSGHLERHGTQFAIRDFKGMIGGSDIAGTLNIDTKGGRPNFRADLTSEKLDFKDLGAVLGTRVSSNAPAETGVGDKPKKLTKMDSGAPHRVIPDAPLDAERVRGMDADVLYHAKALNAPRLPLREVTLHVKLDHGILMLDPAQFTLPQGKIAGSVKIDARGDKPINNVDLTLSKADLASLVHVSGGKPAIEGPLQGRIQLNGAGSSVHEAASHANGAMAIVIPHGTIRKAFAELAGIDVARGLSLLLSGSEEQTQLRCGLAHFNVAKGEVNADNVVLDTDVTKITGSGTLNLGSEALDFQLKGDPKHPSLRVHAPVTLNGTLAHPAIGIAPGPVVAQAGAAGALSILTPIAAVLAFVDPGLADDADCKQVLQSAKQSGAPVSKKEIENAPRAEP